MDDAAVFVHLSDIHFNKKWHDVYDLDADVRDQLELDVARVRSEFANVRGILISGDIAFGGRAEDYDVAMTWLKHLCGIAKCREQDVWCVPGNHDVLRKVWDESHLVRTLHERLRGKPDEIDDRLTECMRDPESAKLLLRSLENYNEFASKFRCASREKPLHWQHDQALNDGWTLRVFGMNSALVSDKDDDAKKLIVGTIQSTPKQQPGVVNLSLCHHPPDWVIDYEKMTHGLNARARVQLFGHKHIQKIEEIDNCLRIGSGAVHPSRREKNWRPRYNWIALRVVKKGDRWLLKVIVYPRVWSESKPEYIADHENCDKGNESRSYTLRLDDWNPPPAVATPAPPSAPAPFATPATGTAATGTTSLPAGGLMDAAKTLTYRFLDLSHLARLEIAQGLKLMADEDEGLHDSELLERMLERAKREKRLAELWDAIESEHADDRNPVNPFKRR